MDLRESLDEMRSAGRPRLVLWPERTVTSRSVALLAGSFDPVTVAHVAMAEAALADADLAVLVYAVRTIPKEPGAAAPLLGEAERLEALAAVCEARPGLVAGLCSHGLLADQVAAAAERFAGATLSVVLGSDKLTQLFDPRWYGDPDAALRGLFAAAQVRYAVRAGHVVEDALRAADGLGFGARVRRLEVDPAAAAVSSRRVRELARAGEDVAGLVPPEAVGAVLRAATAERSS